VVRRAVNEYNEVIVTTIGDKRPKYYENLQIFSIFCNRPSKIDHDHLK